ncbi:hypothetical protein TL16_g08419 [Triparma laevis f. inornata]|uniref:Uncharacterized protein n=1 Tax=Triparma laevis f. inornata TaxID=1714386 RepID=A0A9W7B5T5_9STRA|nr:hypothetical protein TL16_g08419 [Triparma laevis f. inornata]
MTIPDSLQKLGGNVFYGCSVLIPSNLIVNDSNTVVTHLRFHPQLLSATPPAPHTDQFMSTDDFKRQLRQFITVGDLFDKMRQVSKQWQRVAASGRGGRRGAH